MRKTNWLLVALGVLTASVAGWLSTRASLPHVSAINSLGYWVASGVTFFIAVVALIKGFGA